MNMLHFPPWLKRTNGGGGGQFFCLGRGGGLTAFLLYLVKHMPSSPSYYLQSASQMKNWSCGLYFLWAVFGGYPWGPCLQCLAPVQCMPINNPRKLPQPEWQKTLKTGTFLASNQTRTMKEPVDWQGTLQGHQGVQIKSAIKKKRGIQKSIEGCHVMGKTALVMTWPYNPKGYFLSIYFFI